MVIRPKKQWVGIDVSKTTLDIALRPSLTIWQELNQQSGWESIAKILKKQEIELIVVESTGGLERGLVQYLQQQGLSVSVVDSRYQSARQHRGTRKGFFQDLVSLTQYLLFESWEHLLDFLLDEAPPQLAPRRANSS